MSESLLDGVPVEQLEQRMWPGRWSAEGYLREGNSVIEVIKADAAALTRLGIEPAAIASRLEELLERGSASEWEPVHVDHWLVTVRRTRKLRACPWAKSNVDLCTVGVGALKLSSNDFEIRRQGDSEAVSGTGLCVHLIRDHAFFCGPGTRYRMEPETAGRVLKLL
jgi:hypothetical protein